MQHKRLLPHGGVVLRGKGKMVASWRPPPTPYPTTHIHKLMKLHLPSGLRAAILACFAVVSPVTLPSFSAAVAGAVVTVTFFCAASPAVAEDVTWDSNWGASSAPESIPDENVLSDIPSNFTFLSATGSSYTADGKTIVRLAGTAADATDVNVVGGAGMTTDDTSTSEGPITVDTWMKVSGGTYATLVGGSYAQNYSGGQPASFTGDTHLLLAAEGGSTPTVNYIIGGNYMDAQNAVFTGNSYISVQAGTVSGSIIGGGTAAHNQTSRFTGNTNVWIYTPLTGTAENRFNLPGNLIVGGSAGIANSNPKLLLEGNTNVTVDLANYTPDGTAMDKIIIGDAWLQNGAVSTHSGNVAVTIGGEAADSTNVSFSQPVVAGSWFASGGSASLSGTTELNITGGEFSGALVGGSWLSASSNTATQQAGDIALSITGGEVSGNIYGGSYSANENAQSLASHGAISISLTGGNITGNVYAAGGLAEGAQSAITATSTQVEIGNDVTLGSITISGGVENANAASSVSGESTLWLSGTSAYTNLDNVSFEGFSVVNAAANASLNLSTTAASFSKQGAGELTLTGAANALASVESLSVSAGSLDTGASTLTQDGAGLNSLSVAAGSTLSTAALTLADGATLSLGLAASTLTESLVEVTGELTLLGDSALALNLSGVDALGAGSNATLLSWASAASPVTLSQFNWENKGTGMEAYELGIEGNSLVLKHAETMQWDDSGTWSSGSSSDGKATTFDTPVNGEATVSISGDVAPQSIVVNNAADTTYTFEADVTTGGSISGDTSLTKENEGTLVVNLANSYTGGTTVNAGTLDAAAANALGTGEVTLNGGQLVVSAEDAVAQNALVLNGGSLSYSANETRDLGASAISHAAGVVPAVSVATGSTVTWQYADAAPLQAAMVDGLSLSGGGTLVADATDSTADVALTGPIALADSGTTLEFTSGGAKQFGTADAPMEISLAEGTTLRMQVPAADAVSALHTSLSGEGTLEFADSAGTGTVQLSGDNSAFAGSINLGAAPTDAPVAFAAADAPAIVLDYSEGSPVGGAESTLNLNGLSFAIVQSNGSTTATAAALNVNADTVQYAQTAGLANTFSGAVSGEAGTTWTLNTTPVTGGQVNALTGDLSGLASTLAAVGQDGSVATWQLGGEGAAVNPTLALSLTADNEYNSFIVNYADEVTLSGAVTGSANLSQQGAGKLVLTGASSSTGSLSIAEGSVVQLGDAMNAGQWGAAAGSTLAGNGTLILTNGSLGGALALASGSAPVVDVAVAAGKSVDLGGSEGSLLTGGFTLNEGSTLVNVGSSILDKELNLTLADANIGAGVAATAMVQFVDSAPNARAVTASLGSETAAINLDTSAGNVVNLLRQHRAAGTESYLTLTNGALVTAADYSNVNLGGNMDILGSLGLRIDRVDGGSLVLSGEAQGVYIAGAGEDATTVAGYQYFGAYQAVAVMPGETLTLTLDGAPDATLDGTGAVVNNLLGAEDSAFVVNNSNADGEVAVVVLNNAVQSIDPVPEGLPGDPVGANTVFGGTVSQQGGGVQFVKTGAGMLSLGGAITAQQLSAQAGTVALNAAGNALDVLSAEGGTVQLNNGVTTVAALADSDAGGSIAVAQGATLAVTGAGSLEDAVVAGPGALLLSGSLGIAEDARLDGVALNLDGGTLELNANSASSVAELNGNGSLSGAGTADSAQLQITGTNGVFSGSLAGNGSLVVAEGARQFFTSDVAGASGWSLVNNGRVGMNFVREDGSNAALSFDALTLGASSVTDVLMNTSAPASNLLTLGSLAVEQGAVVNVDSSSPDGDLLRADTAYVIGSVSGGQAASTLGTITPNTANPVFMLLDAERTTLSVDEAGNIVLNLVTSRTNKLAALADNTNSAAGAELLWNAAFSGNATAGTDVRRMLEYLNDSANAGEANRALAAASGASATVLSAAFASDIERQLRAIRNRSAMVAGPREVRQGKESLTLGCPRFAAWINGEGDHRKMKADGFMPGYSLSSWGGTLGMEADYGDAFLGGLALTAMYGDLETRSADHAKGDFDRYYLTAYARVRNCRWQHTLLGTVGRMDGDFNRHVDFGDARYSTHSGTKGWGFGFMYEIGYDLPVDENAMFTLQPVANVAWRYADVSSFSERGSDAALRVGSQDYNVVTFGAGLRARAEVGERWFNRRAMMEARALVKVDAGDRHGDAAVAMLNGGAAYPKVRSAKLEAVGVELGVGFNIPLGQNAGSIFIDGNAELRNEYSNLNGAVGYRFEF